MLHALEKVNISRTPTDDKIEKKSTTVESSQRYIQCTKFSGKNMTKISESPHPLKKFRLLKKKKKICSREKSYCFYFRKLCYERSPKNSLLQTLLLW